MRFVESGSGLGALVALLIVSVSTSANAKFATKPMQLPPMRKAIQLNFPPLPKDLQARVETGVTAKPVSPRSDFSFGKDWALSSIGFFEIFTPLMQPNKPGMQKCSNSLVVAVVDTGIDYTHPELKDNVWVNHGESGAWTPPAGFSTACRDKSCNGVDDDNNGFTDDVVGWDFVNEVPLPYDVHGHGTHIAGIISSAPAGNVGMVGVCPAVSIMPLKYYDNSGVGYNNLQNTVRAIQYAVKMGAQIINYSGGGAEPAPSERAAIEEAQRKGILFVAAAGNDGHNNDEYPYFPASYPLDNIISVASVNKDAILLPSSNYGKTVNIAAPGLQIVSTLPLGRFGTMSGTSQATAFVTGAAALLASQWKDRSEFDYKKLKAWLIESAKPMALKGDRKFVNAGLLSVSKSIAVQSADLQKNVKPVAARQEVALKPGQAATKGN